MRNPLRRQREIISKVVQPATANLALAYWSKKDPSMCSIHQPTGQNCESRCQNVGDQAYGAVRAVNSATPYELLWPELETSLRGALSIYLQRTKLEWGFSNIEIHRSVQYVAE